jgi:arylsulfatase A
MMTGRMPYRQGIYGFLHVGAKYQHLRASEVTFPQLLRSAGYQTALVGKWHLSHNDHRRTHPQPSMREYGFDYCFSSDNNTVIRNKPGWWENDLEVGTVKGLAANVVGDRAVHWLKERRRERQPFLLCVHFYEPHWRVEGPDELVKKYERHFPKHPQRAHYPACIENMDHEVGRILDTLRDLGVEERTVVFFTSDNGPAKFGKGRAYERNAGNAGPYRGWKYGLWDGSVHVPGFVRWPGVTRAGRVIDIPAGGIDFLPTVCAMAGVAPPSERPVDGSDLTPLLRGEDGFVRDTPLQWHHYNATLHEADSPQSAVRVGHFVLAGFYERRRPLGTGRWYPAHTDVMRADQVTRYALYDLVADPGQERDVSEDRPETTARLGAKLRTTLRALQTELDDWKGEERAE